jgi:hypothetical protein
MPVAGLILNLIVFHKLIFNIFSSPIAFYKLIHHTYGTKKAMKSEETPSKEGNLRVPKVQLSTTSLSAKISTTHVI